MRVAFKPRRSPLSVRGAANATSPALGLEACHAFRGQHPPPLTFSLRRLSNNRPAPPALGHRTRRRPSSDRPRHLFVLSLCRLLFGIFPAISFSFSLSFLFLFSGSRLGCAIPCTISVNYSILVSGASVDQRPTWTEACLSYVAEFRHQLASALRLCRELMERGVQSSPPRPVC